MDFPKEKQQICMFDLKKSYSRLAWGENDPHQMRGRSVFFHLFGFSLQSGEARMHPMLGESKNFDDFFPFFEKTAFSPR